MSSFWLDSKTGTRYTLGRPFSYGDINYTKQGATAETFKSLGFKEVQIQPRPDDAFYIISGPDDNGDYNATPRDHLDLVENWVIDQSNQANQILSHSDWMVIRKDENGTDIPGAYVTFREEVRNVCGTRQQSLMETKTTQELETLVKAPAMVPIDPADPSKGLKPNPDPHLEPWPEDPEEVQRRKRAEDRAAAGSADAVKVSTKKPGRKA